MDDLDPPIRPKQLGIRKRKRECQVFTFPISFRVLKPHLFLLDQTCHDRQWLRRKQSEDVRTADSKWERSFKK
jgi:hypothetical protein